MACSRTALPDLSAERGLLRSVVQQTRGKPSVQHVLPRAQALVTTNLCAELGTDGVGVLRWFRHVGDAPESHGASDWCRDIKPGDVSHLPTGVHGGWIESAGGVGTVVPCPTLQPFRAPRHDYCLRMTPHAQAPADEIVWQPGVLLIANEAHIENFHHANRDTLFLQS